MSEASDLLARARSAIARARLLTSTYELGIARARATTAQSSGTDHDEEEYAVSHSSRLEQSGAPLEAPSRGFDRGLPWQPCGRDSGSECNDTGGESSGREPPDEEEQISWDGGTRDREMREALGSRLRSLHECQAATMQQLMQLRREQLRLRQQQLSALRCLLRAESQQPVSYTQAQLDAMQQAVSLIGSCLADVEHASRSLVAVDPTQAMAVSQHVSEADARAEEASVIARSLLDFLRMYSADARSSGAGASEGLSEAQMTTLGEVVWRPGGEVGRGGDDLCSVCLGEFMEGDAVRCLPVCSHLFHVQCIDPWLKIKDSCPLCKRSVKEDLERATSLD